MQPTLSCAFHNLVRGSPKQHLWQDGSGHKADLQSRSDRQIGKMSQILLTAKKNHVSA